MRDEIWDIVNNFRYTQMDSFAQALLYQQIEALMIKVERRAKRRKK